MSKASAYFDLKSCFYPINVSATTRNVDYAYGDLIKVRNDSAPIDLNKLMISEIRSWLDHDGIDGFNELRHEASLKWGTGVRAGFDGITAFILALCSGRIHEDSEIRILDDNTVKETFKLTHSWMGSIVRDIFQTDGWWRNVESNYRNYIAVQLFINFAVQMFGIELRPVIMKVCDKSAWRGFKLYDQLMTMYSCYPESSIWCLKKTHVFENGTQIAQKCLSPMVVGYLTDVGGKRGRGWTIEHDGRDLVISKENIQALKTAPKPTGHRINSYPTLDEVRPGEQESRVCQLRVQKHHAVLPDFDQVISEQVEGCGHKVKVVGKVIDFNFVDLWTDKCISFSNRDAVEHWSPEPELLLRALTLATLSGRNVVALNRVQYLAEAAIDHISGSGKLRKGKMEELMRSVDGVIVIGKRFAMTDCQVMVDDKPYVVEEPVKVTRDDVPKRRGTRGKRTKADGTTVSRKIVYKAHDEE